MPTYAYRCTACGHSFDAVQSFHDDPLTVCPECSGALRKLFSGVGVVFRGSGFYRTDSRNGSSSTTTAAPSSGSGADAGGSGSGTSGGTALSGTTSSDSKAAAPKAATTSSST